MAAIAAATTSSTTPSCSVASSALEICLKSKEPFRKYFQENLDRFGRLSSALSGEDLEAVKAKMLAFSNGSDFDEFYTEFTDCAIHLTHEDLDTFGTEKPSETGLRFLRCFERLSSFGFHNAGTKRVCFWSGMEAKKKVLEIEDSIPDERIPMISFGFYLYYTIMRNEDESSGQPFSVLIGAALSRMIATQARGDVGVYISSDKYKERAGVSIGNYFWDNELPTLQRLHHIGVVNRILIFFKQRTSDWESPIDLTDSSGKGILFYRRTTYTAPDARLKDEDPYRFVHMQRWREPERYETWCKEAEARPALTLKRLQQIAHHWLAKSKHHSGGGAGASAGGA